MLVWLQQHASGYPSLIATSLLMQVVHEATFEKHRYREGRRISHSETHTVPSNRSTSPTSTSEPHTLPSNRISQSTSSSAPPFQRKWAHNKMGPKCDACEFWPCARPTAAYVEIGRSVASRYPEDSVLLLLPDNDIQDVLIPYGELGLEWIANGDCSLDLVHEAVYVFYPVVWKQNILWFIALKLWRWGEGAVLC